MTTPRNPVFCAIDTPDLTTAQKLAEQIRDHVYGLKLGLEFFMAQGAVGYRAMARYGLPIFLDVKLHDIPNTVAGAIGSLLPVQPDFITLHTSGGAAMMRSAVEASRQTDVKRPKLLGVTVLTSLDAEDLGSVGQDPRPAQQVTRLSTLAQTSGMDGVICSPAEITALRGACGADFILMVPGIRPMWASTQDQKRVMTPREAMDAGATYLVIGRPITGDTHPRDAAQRILDTL